MGFSLFSTPASPIAIDFGSSSVKLLQIGAGDRPQILGAAEIPIPDSARFEPDRVLGYYAEQFPKTLAAGQFKSRRAIIAIPSTQTFIQHMQFAPVNGVADEELITAQLQNQMGCLPNSVVVRTVGVADVHRGGQAQKEVICFAIARDTVMRYVAMLKKCKINVVGVHTEPLAIVRAFDHLNRRQSDSEVTTLYVDLGWGGTHVAIAHGRELKFARYIQIGGRHFDQHITGALNVDMATARAQRLSIESPLPHETTRQPPEPTSSDHGALLGAAASAQAVTSGSEPGAEVPGLSAPGPGTEVDERRQGMVPAATCSELPGGNPPYHVGDVDLSELLDTVTDELSMCLRYHQGLFPHRSISRAIFVGGEARQVWLCQHLVKALRVPAQLGDPISRLSHEPGLKTPGVDLDEPQPGWTVNCGLCNAPTDL